MAENEALRALYAQLAKALGGPHWRGALQLLAARLLSAQYYPQRYQLRLADYEETGAFAEPTAATVWDMVAAGQTQRAAEALRQACAAYPGLAAALGVAEHLRRAAPAALHAGDDDVRLVDHPAVAAGDGEPAGHALQGRVDARHARLRRARPARAPRGRHTPEHPARQPLSPFSARLARPCENLPSKHR